MTRLERRLLKYCAPFICLEQKKDNEVYYKKLIRFKKRGKSKIFIQIMLEIDDLIRNELDYC